MPWVLGHHIWIRCAGCSHSAVILPAVLAQLVGYDFPLAKAGAAHEVRPGAGISGLGLERLNRARGEGNASGTRLPC